MGIIKAVTSAIGGSLADQWLEVIEPDAMGQTTVMAAGVQMRKDSRRNQNTKSNAYTISDGSVIHVYPNQFMMLLDGGKVVDYTAEEGYYTVKNSSLPSLFNGQFGETFKETFRRVKYAGIPSSSQKVFYINLQEIKGIKFGTRNPINYFDAFYNAELFLRAHGTYSIKITDPMLFFFEAIPRDKSTVDIAEINEQYLSEFMSALQAAINQMSADGTRVSYAPSKSQELSRYMAQTLDEDWKRMRGFEVQAVGIASLSYDEESQKLINMRNQGAMLSDPVVREGYVQGAMARGVEAAGSNAAGATQGFLGVGLGMQSGGNFVGAASQANQAQMAMQQKSQAPAAGAPLWKCECGGENTGKFCTDCGKPKPAAAEGWKCECGRENTGKFCTDCGKPKPAAAEGWKCECGTENAGKFCTGCGKPKAEKTVCPECGHELPEGASSKFCPQCGKKLS